MDPRLAPVAHLIDQSLTLEWKAPTRLGGEPCSQSSRLSLLDWSQMEPMARSMLAKSQLYTAGQNRPDLLEDHVPFALLHEGKLERMADGQLDVSGQCDGVLMLGPTGDLVFLNPDPTVDWLIVVAASPAELKLTVAKPWWRFW